MHMASRGRKINLLLPGPDLVAGTVAAGDASAYRPPAATIAGFSAGVSAG